MSDGVAELVWYGYSAGARAARAALSPFAALFGAAASVRGTLYDSGVLHTRRGPIPAVSVGNLTVGGTGKTPFAAWLAGELMAHGAHPAIVLRGFGDDEPLVHERLNPGVPVIVSPDRVAGVARAAAGGADIAVLDDAFQHRRAARDADIVLVSADRWSDPARLLPVGPFREPLSALRRASLIVITAKAATPERIASVRTAAALAAPAVPQAVVRFTFGMLKGGAGGVESRPLESLRDTSVFAFCAVGDPRAFSAQLLGSGARLTVRVFPDHHAFTAEDAASLAGALTAAMTPVCTLKDYVKLAPLWPRQAPALWYVSQRSAVEEGRAALDALVDSLLRARIAHP